MKRSSLLVQWVEGTELLLWQPGLPWWHGFHPSPGNFRMSQAQTKKKKMTLKKKIDPSFHHPVITTTNILEGSSSI